MSALAALVAVAVMVLLTLPPLLSAEAERTDLPEDSDLGRRRDELLSSLRDVDLDHAMGKITPDDRERLRAELEGRVVRVMADIDAAKPADPERGA